MASPEATQERADEIRDELRETEPDNSTGEYEDFSGASDDDGEPR